MITVDLLGLEKKPGRMFCVRQVYFAKSCQQIWVRVNQPFMPFIHHIWGETVLWGTVFIMQTLDRKQYFTILRYKLHSFNIKDDGSTRGLLAKPLKKFPKSPIRPSVLTFVARAVAFVWMNINRVMLQHNKGFIMFIFHFKMAQRAEFWVLLQAMFTERLKTIGTAIKITRETTNSQ